MSKLIIKTNRQDKEVQIFPGQKRSSKRKKIGFLVRYSDVVSTFFSVGRLMIGYERYGMGSNKWTKIKMDPDFGDIVSLSTLL